MRRTVPVILAALATCLLPAGSAQAQQGVTIDPSSPASKEYEIPLEGARQQASGGGDDAPATQGERSAPLFGEGVGPSGGDASDATSGEEAPSVASSGGTTPGEDPATAGGRAKGGDAEPSDAAGATARRDRAKDVYATAYVKTPPEGGFSDGATIAALAFAVLVLGGVAGSILRRRSA